jgi:hypothetical protein
MARCNLSGGWRFDRDRIVRLSEMLHHDRPDHIVDDLVIR